MKTIFLLCFLVTRHPSLVTAALLFLFATAAFPQGILTPPAGTPAPTMKTLDQVEPRIPINATNTPGDADSVFRISASGSYYLTGNITGAASKHGIEIATANVTVDLMGYALLGVASSLDGINSSSGNLTVRNGVVTGFGQDGVDLGNSTNVAAQRVEQVHASNNTGIGIRVGHNGSTVTGCTAYQNGSTGITGGYGAIVNKCTTRQNADDGISVTEGATVIECTAYQNEGDGIQASFNCRIVGNTCSRNGLFGGDGAGIHIITNGGNRIEGNHLTGNDRGLDIDVHGNTIRGNTVQANGDNYDIVAGNQVEILLSQLPETIEVPAKVTLAGSLISIAGQNGITVTSDDVTIDLDGHALIGVASSLDGINISGSHKNIVIKNGTVRSWAGDGIDAATSTNGQFDRLQLTDNTGRGIHAGERCLVTDCIARNNTGVGIEASIIATITRCVSFSSGGFGIKTEDTSQIEKCNLNNNTGGGISVTNNSLVRENNCDFHTSVNVAGILVTGSRNRIESNLVTRNTRGIDVDGANNLIVKNSASGNTGPGPLPAPNYDIVGGNDVGPIGSAAASTSPWANISF